MANHKRGKRKSRRAGCLFCKAWKHQAMPKWSHFKISELRKLQEPIDGE